jgi:cytochrome c oxidase assembly protein subunit 15
MNAHTSQTPPVPVYTMPTYRQWLHAFCIFSVVMVLGLLAIGGTVTSKGAGMAVPDWPQTNGYNMFLFPISMWKGGIFWEHTHRLWASTVGFLAIILCVWLWVTQKNRRWMQWLGVGLLVMVIVQGVLGGIRVTEIDWRFGIVHGILGQLYFCFVVLAAAATGKKWLTRPPAGFEASKLNKAVKRGWLLIVVLLIQLSLGAAMRHSGAGLSVPDFPTFYGKWLPPVTQKVLDADLAKFPENIQHDKNGDVVHFTIFHVHLHMGHRLWALAVIAHVFLLLASLKAFFTEMPTLAGPMRAILLLLLVQVALGILVIWTGKHPEIATAHQVVGATLLALAGLIQMRMMRLRYLAAHHVYALVPTQPHDNTSSSRPQTGAAPGATA